MWGCLAFPYSNRTADVQFPRLSLEGQPRVTVEGVIDDFEGQLGDFFPNLEALVLLGQTKVPVTCRTARALEELTHRGLTFRSHPDVFVPCSKFKWVNVTRLSYGVSDEAVVDALSPFGRVMKVKMDAYKNIYVGTRNVQIEIRSAIPSRLMIAGHSCMVFHDGQQPTCFACNATGHTSRDCPDRPGPPVARPTGAHVVEPEPPVPSSCRAGQPRFGWGWGPARSPRPSSHGAGRPDAPGGRGRS